MRSRRSSRPGWCRRRSSTVTGEVAHAGGHHADDHSDHPSADRRIERPRKKDDFVAHRSVHEWIEPVGVAPVIDWLARGHRLRLDFAVITVKVGEEGAYGH